MPQGGFCVDRTRETASAPSRRRARVLPIRGACRHRRVVRGTRSDARADRYARAGSHADGYRNANADSYAHADGDACADSCPNWADR